MPRSVACSTKIITLSITPILLILVGVPCEIVMVPGM